MCGRYTLHLQKQKLAEAIAAALPDDYEPDYNIGPGREVLTLALDPESGGAAPGRMHWGLRTPQNFHVNARIETADTAPRFREGWAEHRCLVPANGFYEWYEDGLRKQPFYLYPESGNLLYFAGLWFPSQVDAHPASCVILTTAANESVGPVHSRMPVLLDPSLHADWLRHKLGRGDAVARSEATRLSAHTVSQRVNSVRNNDSSLIREVGALADDQMLLF